MTFCVFSRKACFKYLSGNIVAALQKYCVSVPAGLLSYPDFCFLLTLLSTPPRYIDTAFNLFDVTGEGSVSAAEFAYVTAYMTYR